MSDVPMTRPDPALAIHEEKYGHTLTFVEPADARILRTGGVSLFSASEDGGRDRLQEDPLLKTHVQTGEQFFQR